MVRIIWRRFRNAVSVWSWMWERDVKVSHSITLHNHVYISGQHRPLLISLLYHCNLHDWRFPPKDKHVFLKSNSGHHYHFNIGQYALLRIVLSHKAHIVNRWHKHSITPMRSFLTLDWLEAKITAVVKVVWSGGWDRVRSQINKRCLNNFLVPSSFPAVDLQHNTNKPTVTYSIVVANIWREW